MSNDQKVRLNCDTVAAMPRDFDFGIGYGERWEVIWPNFDADTAVEFLDDNWYEFEPAPEDPDDWNQERISQAQEAASESGTFEPMMNFLYPLPHYDGDECLDQGTLSLPACVLVRIDEDGDGCPDTVCLALSGGGMDLSWEICESYMSLGYMPPVHFAADLPRMAGRGQSERDRAILAACRQSCSCMRAWMEGGIRRCNDIERGES